MLVAKLVIKWLATWATRSLIWECPHQQGELELRGLNTRFYNGVVGYFKVHSF